MKSVYVWHFIGIYTINVSTFSIFLKLCFSNIRFSCVFNKMFSQLQYYAMTECKLWMLHYNNNMFLFPIVTITRKFSSLNYNKHCLTYTYTFCVTNTNFVLWVIYDGFSNLFNCNGIISCTYTYTRNYNCGWSNFMYEVWTMHCSIFQRKQSFRVFAKFYLNYVIYGDVMHFKNIDHSVRALNL